MKDSPVKSIQNKGEENVTNHGTDMTDKVPLLTAGLGVEQVHTEHVEVHPAHIARFAHGKVFTHTPKYSD